MRRSIITGAGIALFVAGAALISGCPPDKKPGGSGEPEKTTVAKDETKKVVEPAVKPAKPAPPPPVCASCHEPQHKFWAYGKHSGIACVDCHREPGSHLVEKIDPRPNMKKVDRELCLDCHEMIKDASEKNLTIDERLENHMLFLVNKHVIKIDRSKIKGRCVYCHDPHMGR